MREIARACFVAGSGLHFEFRNAGEGGAAIDRLKKQKNRRPASCAPQICETAGAAVGARFYLEGCTLQRRIVPTGGRGIPARPRDSLFSENSPRDALPPHSFAPRAVAFAWGTRSRRKIAKDARQTRQNSPRKHCAGCPAEANAVGDALRTCRLPPFFWVF